jgi:hypothetical protein
VLKTFRTLYDTGRGLFGENCNVQSASCSGKFSVGGGSDSGYEYFAKMYVMSGKKVSILRWNTFFVVFFFDNLQRCQSFLSCGAARFVT